MSTNLICRIAKPVLLTNIVTFGIYAIGLLVRDTPMTAIAISSLAIVPMVMYLRGKPYGLELLKASVLIMFFLWLMSAIVSHAVERTPLFWGIWIYFGVAISTTGVIAFGTKQGTSDP